MFLDDTTAATEVNDQEGFDQDVGENDNLGRPTYGDQLHIAIYFFSLAACIV